MNPSLAACGCCLRKERIVSSSGESVDGDIRTLALRGLHLTSIALLTPNLQKKKGEGP
jgi:hypothetical protein